MQFLSLIRIFAPIKYPKSQLYYMKRIFVLLMLSVLGVSLYAVTVRVGVLLPLKENTERGNTLVEFYRGVLMAVEQVKQEGTNVEVTAIDCGSSETGLREALHNPLLEHLDVIFGPVDAVQVTSLSEFCREHRIRMVLPFNTPCPQVYSNPWIYQVGVAQELLYPNIASLLTSAVHNANFVFFHSGENDERGKSFSTHLSQVLSLKNIPTTELKAGADEFALDLALNQYRHNIIVPDSRSQGAISKLVSTIRSYVASHPKYNISFLGYPEWVSYTKSMLSDFYRYDTYVYATYYRNPLSSRVSKFEQQYKTNFGTASRLSFPRAEMLGYDLAYYFIAGLALLGIDFEEAQPSLNYETLQHSFKFVRVGENGGFVNQHVQLVHYTKNRTIETIR